ncbi:hypothetical protein GQ53DRAFT_810090 [Thozetella sp. PMI_491]|nr:hypothetical protein GQ53DRAFT_810090 [Thozetella sp. PMI_491]
MRRQVGATAASARPNLPMPLCLWLPSARASPALLPRAAKTAGHSRRAAEGTRSQAFLSLGRCQHKPSDEWHSPAGAMARMQAAVARSRCAAPSNYPRNPGSAPVNARASPRRRRSSVKWRQDCRW